jgi:hypothetical protein
MSGLNQLAPLALCFVGGAIALLVGERTITTTTAQAGMNKRTAIIVASAAGGYYYAGLLGAIAGGGGAFCGPILAFVVYTQFVNAKGTISGGGTSAFMSLTPGFSDIKKS